ncbi:major facilitator superfamily domain-containing protein [Phlyctochytrium arcticum]|nr:major facilitator superfamily domain-containing protein [Phlyctochytrium arcticum]
MPGGFPDTSDESQGFVSVEPQDNVVVVDDEIEVEEAVKSKVGAYLTVLFAGFALLSDGYQNGIVSFLNAIFSRLYPAEFTAPVSTRISNAALAGQIIGQLAFGLVVDRIGRKTGLVLCTMLVVVGAGLTAASTGRDAAGMFWMMTVMRFLLGVGVGGEYPCSSASASEAADVVVKGRRGGVFVMVTNVVIDIGFVMAAVVPAGLLLGFGGWENGKGEIVWRLALGAGMLPPLSVLYFRIKSLNVDQYTRHNLKRSVPYRLILARYWPRLLLTSSLWFLYDFIAYPAGIFWSVIISAAVPDPSNLFHTQLWGILLTSFYLPGALGGAWAVDALGRRKTMTLGFVGVAVVGVMIVLVRDWAVQHCFPLFVILYGVYLSASEFGPGDCIGLTAAEIYPTAIRGTAYGISAAIGKFGAVTGTLIFRPLIGVFDPGDTMGQKVPFLLGALIALLGAGITYYFLPEFEGRSLEEEDVSFRAYLEENGVRVSELMGVESRRDNGDRRLDEENERLL